jgi:N-hydroxyarylamine O-acetyltransferase
VVADGPELVLQTAAAERWLDVYGFLPEAVPFVDLETSNWWTSTHPHSPFVTGLAVSLQADDGMRTSLSDWSELALTEQTPAGSTVTPVSREDVPRLLATRFGLGGFALGSDGHVVLA